MVGLQPASGGPVSYATRTVVIRSLRMFNVLSYLAILLIKMRSIEKAAACVFAFAIAIARVQVISTREIPLTFSLIVSYGRFGYNSSPSIPAIDLALEHIHNSGVLGEYKLQYSTVKDSEV